MIKEHFSKDEFINQAISRGYAEHHERSLIKRWCREHPEEYYTEEDLMVLYSWLNYIHWTAPDVKQEKWGNGNSIRRHTKHRAYDDDYDDDNWN